MQPARDGRHAEPELYVPGYCVHCRSRRQMLGAIQVCNRRGGRDLKGHCAVCGKSMYRLGGWETVAAAHSETETEATDHRHTASAPAREGSAKSSPRESESMVY